jgi:hypothetical protein
MASICYDCKQEYLEGHKCPRDKMIDYDMDWSYDPRNLFNKGYFDPYKDLILGLYLSEESRKDEKSRNWHWSNCVCNFSDIHTRGLMRLKGNTGRAPIYEIPLRIVEERHNSNTFFAILYKAYQNKELDYQKNL